jgi:hypothetical protein
MQLPSLEVGGGYYGIFYDYYSIKNLGGLAVACLLA